MLRSLSGTLIKGSQFIISYRRLNSPFFDIFGKTEKTTNKDEQYQLCDCVPETLYALALASIVRDDGALQESKFFVKIMSGNLKTWK